MIEWWRVRGYVKGRTKSFKRKIWRRVHLYLQDYMCFYCRKTLEFKGSTLDHVYPQSLGGKDSLSNLVACCKKCNSKKGSKTLKELMHL